LGRNTRSRASPLKDIISKKALQKWARCGQTDYLLGSRLQAFFHFGVDDYLATKTNWN
jgi:hypothetical protein